MQTSYGWSNGIILDVRFSGDSSNIVFGVITMALLIFIDNKKIAQIIF